MNITSAKYYDENRHIQAVIDGQEMSIPCVNENRHYQEILKWVEEGNVIEEAD